MEIKEAALQLKDEYTEEYHKYCKETGNIMHGASSKAMCMDLAKHCDTIEELNTLHKVHYRRAQEMKGPHGFNFFTQAIIELMKRL